MCIRDSYQIAYTPGKKKEVIDFLRNLEYKLYGSEDFEYTFPVSYTHLDVYKRQPCSSSRQDGQDGRPTP